MSENIKNFAEYTKSAYLEYAMSVVKGRSLICIQDGLKPVHRRVIYAMNKMGINHTGAPTKSARITGEVIGKYHPHGDTAVYEAMVFLTQDFRHRYPLLEGQGNFGMRDNPKAYAAARYTETKFFKMSEILHEELNEDAVKFLPNYDGKEVEPEFLPARLPIVLLNSSEGVGVGFSSKTPSHNMKEVGDAVIHYLSNENVQLADIMQYIKGPDFPTGATLISKEEDIVRAYTEGKGSFRLRGKYFIENEGSKNWKIVFTELPYEVSVQKIVEQINNRMYPEVDAKKDKKGRPILKDEDLRLKQLFQNLIADFRDESDRETPLRLVITPKIMKRKESELIEEIVQLLYGYTDVETNFNAQFVLVGLDGNVRQMSLLDIISEWTQFRIETVKRRCEFHLRKVNARLHILAGREIAYNNLDEIIKIVQHAEVPKKDLMEKFALSEIQADDILDMKLRQLSNLELKAVLKEQKQCIEKKDELEAILATDKSLKKQIIKEIKADVKNFADDRKTEIAPAEKVDLAQLQQKTVKIAEEDITLAVSEKGWVKTFKGKKVDDDISFKDGDNLSYKFYCKNTDQLGVFDKTGKLYSYPLIEIPKDGVPVITLADFRDRISLVFPVSENKKYLIAQNTGFGFIVSGENLITRMKAGKDMVTIANDGELFQPIPLEANEDISDYRLALINTENKVLVYKLSEVNEIAKGKGITILGGLSDTNRIKDLKIIKDMKLVVEGKPTKGRTETLTFEGESLVAIEKGRATKGSILGWKDKLSEVSFKEDVIVEEIITGK